MSKEIDKKLKKIEELEKKLEAQLKELNERNNSESKKLVDALNKSTNPIHAINKELEEMPLDTYEDYLKHNEKVREYRLKTRKPVGKIKYCPLEKLKLRKCKITRTSNRGVDIDINLKLSKEAIWFKGKFKDGEEVLLPDAIINKINSLSVPIYKQVKTKDGGNISVLDYYENKYNCSVMV